LGGPLLTVPKKEEEKNMEFENKADQPLQIHPSF
jgi:hypothetical protein